MRQLSGLFLIAFFWVLAQPADAQLSVGVRGGMVMSSLVRDSQLKANAGLLGYLAGVNARLSLGELGWFVETGVSYTLEGDSQQKLNFVKVPAILGLEVSDGLAVYGAYQLCWQVGDDNNVKDFYHGFANILGLGAEIYVSKKFSIGSQLNYGLSNLVETPADAGNFKVKPFTLDLYLTYYIL